MAVLNIDYGSIKKFTVKTRDNKTLSITGVYIKGDAYTDFIISLEGKRYQVNDLDIINISATRLAPEIRELFNTIHKCNSERLIIADKLKELRTQDLQYSDKMKAAIHVLGDKAIEQSTGISVSACQALIDKYSPYLSKCSSGNYFSDNRNYYTLEFDKTNLSIVLNVDTQICKYVKPENYPFLFREYDDNIFVDRTAIPVSYFEKYSNNLVNRVYKDYISSITKADVKHHSGFNVGDKNTLYYYECVSIRINSNLELNLVDKLLHKWFN